LDKKLATRILARYPHASLLQRCHIRGRLHLCPYDALPKYLTGADNLLDVGCGFGHLAWYLDEIGSLSRKHHKDKYEDLQPEQDEVAYGHLPPRP
jgi:hypothetical protein